MNRYVLLSLLLSSFVICSKFDYVEFNETKTMNVEEGSQGRIESGPLNDLKVVYITKHPQKEKNAQVVITMADVSYSKRSWYQFFFAKDVGECLDEERKKHDFNDDSSPEQYLMIIGRRKDTYIERNLFTPSRYYYDEPTLATLQLIVMVKKALQVSDAKEFNIDNSSNLTSGKLSADVNENGEVVIKFYKSYGQVSYMTTLFEKSDKKINE